MGGEVTDEEAEAAIDQWLAENAEKLEQKLDGYGTMIHTLEARSDTRQGEARRLQQMAVTDLNAAKRLKERLKWFMENRAGANKIETKLHKFAISKNGGKTPVHLSERIRPEDMYDHPAYQGFVRVVYEWDMGVIRNALEDGTNLPFATLGERGTHLRVR